MPAERNKICGVTFRKEHDFDYNLAVYSLKRFMLGFFAKYFIANRLGSFVDTFYGNLGKYSGGILFISSILYSMQIYFDFSGYSSMAIGLAGLFDIKLDENFNSPYFSQSIRTFWSRWHISLTSWFRDYLYIPLGGNRCSNFRNALNVIITFMVSGLWHGANYTFLVWGGMHGIAQVIENNIGGKKFKESKGIIGWIRVLIVFLFVNYAWIFFRAPDLKTALIIISSSLKGIINPIDYCKETVDFFLSYSGKKEIVIACIFIFGYAFIDFWKAKGKNIDFVSNLKAPLRWIIYILAIFITMYFATPGTSSFIYFKF